MAPMARAQYDLPCQWQQAEVEAPEAGIPACPRPGQEKRGNLGAAREAIKALGAISWSWRAPPRALSSQTALTRRVLAPATADTGREVMPD